MKVITIGRSHDNDVCINDPYVGRHHCQIVQFDDGSFSIMDMNSTNGTYVNGRRVYGEVKLQPYDSITIGHVNLPWRSYSPSKSKSYALPIILVSVGGVLLTVLLTLLIFRHSSDKAFAFKGEYPDAVVVNMVNEEGSPYTIEAIEGQVCVWFEEGVPYKTAKKSIKKSGGRIVAQIPEDGYYLVEVPADKVQNFLKRITKENFVDWAYPNMIYYPCIAKNYILDNYYPDKSKKNKDDTPHGVIVQFAMQQCGSGSPLDTFNIGTKDGKSMKTAQKWHVPMSSTDNLAFATSVIAASSDSGPIIINMSFGPYLRQREDSVYYWEKATLEEKKDYQERYLNSIRNIIKNVSKLKDKDYIIVKSAGNNGVKVFDAAIISYLRKNLEPDELEILDKHFVIVAAGEKYNVDRYSKIEKDYKDLYDKAVRKKDQELMIRYDTNWRNAKKYVHYVSTYSNEMESSHYDPWVTKVDISDFEFHGKHVPGTSIAAPRAACILSSVANEMNLTGAEVLKYAREATLHDPNHVLTYESLLMTVLADRENRSQNGTIRSDNTQPVKHEPSQISSQTQTQNNNTSVRPKENRHVSGMGQYDYSFTISYSEELFKNKTQRYMNLPNGDVINYQYVYECDFLPEYYMKFTLGNGGDITSKYSIVLVETLQAEKGYVGTDENGYIDMRISYMGFDPKSSSKMIVLIKRK